MPVSELLSRMSSRELAEWMAYENLTGTLSQERDDLLTGIVAAITHNLWAKKPRKVTDFLPVWHRKKKTDQEMGQLARVLNQMFGGEET